VSNCHSQYSVSHYPDGKECCKLLYFEIIYFGVRVCVLNGYIDFGKELSVRFSCTFRLLCLRAISGLAFYVTKSCGCLLVYVKFCSRQDFTLVLIKCQLVNANLVVCLFPDSMILS